MATKKSREEIEAEHRLIKSGQTALAISSNVNTLIRYGGMVLITYFIYLSIAALAGHHTMADIGIKFLGNLQVSQSVACIFGVGGTTYGYAQNRSRKKTIEHMAERIRELESKIDPKRSSSRLTKRGETRPEDIL